MALSRSRGLLAAVALFLVGAFVTYGYWDYGSALRHTLSPYLGVWPVEFFVGVVPVLVFLALREDRVAVWFVLGLFVLAFLSEASALLARWAVQGEVLAGRDFSELGTSNAPLTQVRLYVELTLVMSGFYAASSVLWSRYRRSALLVLLSLPLAISPIFHVIYEKFPGI